MPPIIPFALGSLGFLTCFEFTKYAQVLNAAIDDGVRVNLRSRFKVTVYRAVEGDEQSRRARRSAQNGDIFLNNISESGGWESIESGAAQENGNRTTRGKDREIKCYHTRASEVFEVLNVCPLSSSPAPFLNLSLLFVI